MITRCPYHNDIPIQDKFTPCWRCQQEILEKYKNGMPDEEIIDASELVEIDTLYKEPK